MISAAFKEEFKEQSVQRKHKIPALSLDDQMVAIDKSFSHQTFFITHANNFSMDFSHFRAIDGRARDVSSLENITKVDFAQYDTLRVTKGNFLIYVTYNCR